MQIADWNALDPAGRRAALDRPCGEARLEIGSETARIVADVRARGDASIRDHTARLDGVTLESIAVTQAEFAAARTQIDASAVAAMKQAIANVTRFHAAQMPQALVVDTMAGVRCERIARPVQAVGLYVPAGSAPLPSTVIMLAVPARVAGCAKRILCTPPLPDCTANASVLVAAQLCGVDRVFKVGGAQAIAAMAFGTKTLPKVDKIFGPGNAWVTAAKQIVAADPEGAALDLPAGPSEVLVIADELARADFVAADLLAQCEHDPRSQALLVTPSRPLAERVLHEIEQQLAALSRIGILRQSVANSRAIVVADMATAIAVSNAYAPEHLILQVAKPRELLGDIVSAGSIFLGEWSPEPMGDYCSGANHVLPTYGYARAYSGLSVQSFLKLITVQELTPAGLRALGPVASTLAALEGLDAHVAAVDIRLSVLRARESA